MILSGQVSELRVPVVPNGKDKIVYIIEHNNNWAGTMHFSVTVNDKKVDRLSTAFVNNPFATHYNSKLYSRYLATRIPADYIKPGDNFISLKIDMSGTNNYIHFREAGTHDYM